MAPSQKRELTFSDYMVAVAGTNTMYGREVALGEVQVIQHVAARNNTNAVTRLLLEKERLNRIWPIEDTPAPAAGTFYTFHDEIYLYHGDRLLIRWVGCALNDVLDWNYLGYIKPTD